MPTNAVFLLCHRSVTFSGQAIGSTKPLTAQVTDSVDVCTAEVARSRSLREQVAQTIDNVQALQEAAFRTVNEGLTQKVAETITLKVRTLIQDMFPRITMDCKIEPCTCHW